MSNGHIDAAETEAMLTGDRRAVDRYLVVSIQQLTTAVEELQRICEARGKTCPAVVSDRTGKAVLLRVVDRVAVPIVVVLLTLGITHLIGG